MPEPKTIDITPSWPAALQILLAALQNGTPEGKRIARAELRHMAQAAEAAKQAITARDELLAALHKIAFECASYNECWETAQAALAKAQGG